MNDKIVIRMLVKNDYRSWKTLWESMCTHDRLARHVFIGKHTKRTQSPCSSTIRSLSDPASSCIARQRDTHGTWPHSAKEHRRIHCSVFS